MSRRSPLRSLRRPVAVVGAVVAVVALGAVAVSARTGDGPSYRTATVGRHAVDQVLSTVGVVEPVSQASVAFPVAGTVSSVWVAVGDQVQVGDHLATLDTEDLEDAVHEAQATLDQAELDLQLALDGQVPSSSLSGAGGAGGGGFGRSAGASLASAIAAAQQDVLAAQQAVDEALAEADAALASAQAVCGTSSTAADAGTGGADATTTTTTPGDATSDACSQALAASLAAQQAVADAQDELATAVGRLADLLDQAASGGTTTTTTTPAGQGGGASGGGASSGGSAPTGSGAAGSSGSSGTPSSTGTASAAPSAADLVAYQKQVDAATQALAVAEQALAQATIVSPIDGTVVSVGLAKGEDVTAASATQAIVIAGEGGYEVTTQVAVSDLPDLEVGQAAVVVPDGGKRRYAGEIVRIGVTGDSSGSTTTYPVTIALTGDTSALGNGSTASVEITTDAARKAIAVPTSAITTNGTRSTVQVISDGKATTTRVEVGAVGRRWIEVTSGVDVGDEVVLADLDEPLPGSATQSSNGNGAQGNVRIGGGGFPGGTPPSGFPGGGPGGN